MLTEQEIGTLVHTHLHARFPKGTGSNPLMAESMRQALVFYLADLRSRGLITEVKEVRCEFIPQPAHGTMDYYFNDWGLKYGFTLADS